MEKAKENPVEKKIVKKLKRAILKITILAKKPKKTSFFCFSIHFL